MENQKLLISDIFYSIQGETSASGFTSLFIRLAGCNLHCSYCDTPEARTGGIEMNFRELLSGIESKEPFHHITVTGGEPLCQGGSIPFVNMLAGRGYRVQLETNGSISFQGISKDVRIISDVKCPSSGEEASFLESNIVFFKKGDEIKFVISDMEDYNFAVDFIKTRLNGVESVIDFSPVQGAISAAVLAELIIRDRLQVRLNLQLHKIIGFA